MERHQKKEIAKNVGKWGARIVGGAIAVGVVIHLYNEGKYIIHDEQSQKYNRDVTPIPGGTIHETTEGESLRRLVDDSFSVDDKIARVVAHDKRVQHGLEKNNEAHSVYHKDHFVEELTHTGELSPKSVGIVQAGIKRAQEKLKD